MKVITLKYGYFFPVNFNASLIIYQNRGIFYFKNGKSHRKGGPAVIHNNHNLYYCFDGQLHREDGPSAEFADGDKEWHYKNKIYGKNNDFTNKTWVKKVKELKRQEKLSIFI